MSTTCLRCHRPLSDPVSQQRGLGPICAVLRDAAVEQEKVMSTPPKLWPEFDYQKAAEDISKQNDIAEGYCTEYIAERFEFGVGAIVRKPNTESPLPHVVYHSPTGFEYGYGGSGPADLARSILAHAVGLPIADRYYQYFKAEFVAGAKDRFSISLMKIRAWVIEQIGKETA